MIPPGHKENFATLRRAFAESNVALMQCNNKKTGEPVYVICVMNRRRSETEFVPIAKFFDGNPYNEVTPPR